MSLVNYQLPPRRHLLLPLSIYSRFETCSYVFFRCSSFQLIDKFLLPTSQLRGKSLKPAAVVSICSSRQHLQHLRQSLKTLAFPQMFRKLKTVTTSVRSYSSLVNYSFLVLNFQSNLLLCCCTYHLVT